MIKSSNGTVLHITEFLDRLHRLDRLDILDMFEYAVQQLDSYKKLYNLLSNVEFSTYFTTSTDLDLSDGRKFVRKHRLLHLPFSGPPDKVPKFLLCDSIGNAILPSIWGRNITPYWGSRELVGTGPSLAFLLTCSLRITWLCGVAR